MIDNTIPQQTILYYPKGYSIFMQIIGLSCIAMAVVALFMVKGFNFVLIIAAILFITFGFFLCKSGFEQFRDRRAQITIDHHGIQTVNTQFYEWSDIKNDEVIAEGRGKHIIFYLVYDYPGGSEKLRINDYPIEQRRLIKLLRAYRLRYNEERSRRQ